MRNNPTMMPPYPANSSGLAWPSSPYNDYLSHSSGQRIQTASIEIKAIRAKYPDRHLTIVSSFTTDLLGFATSDQARVTVNPEASDTVIEHGFALPARRHGGGEGSATQDVKFAAYDYEYQGTTFLLYFFHASEGISMTYRAQFLLSPPGSKKADGEVDEEAEALIAAATKWGQASHEEAWVFDRGFWQKDKEFYKSIQEANWDDVILDEEKKKALVDDVEGFFSSEESYKEFAVPWKRGLIFYGPPGNGKTISIKALMNTISKQKHPSVEMLYVKSLVSFAGPEYAILMIFMKARQMAPCMLIFEDIDSLVNPLVRSYFLNAVDGLESNHGILMIGSTNHLERLDPGIAKRPSRFDRKYQFALPTRGERVQYAQYWRKKLSGNKKIDFPEVLCDMIAGITEDFSFAYMKEAFVAALLVIVAKKEEHASASGGGDMSAQALQHYTYIGRNIVFGDRVIIGGSAGGGDGGDDPDGRKQAEKTLLWREIQKQVKILREEMETSAVQERIKLDMAMGDAEAGLYRMSLAPSRFA